MSAPPAAWPTSKRVKTPTLLQMEAVECGAAALGIVLGHHGRVVSLEELRVACGVSRDGTRASNIVKAARAYGLNARGLSKQPRDLPLLPLPHVVFWNFNHFVVVEGFRKGRVYLNDPAVGPRVVSEAEFEEAFTGVVLVFERGPQFAAGGARPGLLGPLRRRLEGSGVGLAYVLLASLALALTGLVLPVFALVFVDHCLAGGRADWLAPLLLGMALTAAGRAGLTWLQRQHLLRLETKLALASSYRFMRHVLRLPVEFFTQRYGGEVGARVEANDRVAVLLSGELAANLLSALMAVCYLALMLYFDALLALAVAVLAGLNVLALRLVSRRRRDLNVRLLQERGKLLAASLAGLQNVETVKAGGTEGDLFSRWSGQHAKVLAAGQQMRLTTLGLLTAPAVLSALASLAVLGLGAVQVMDGAMTLGTLVAFQGLAVSFLHPVNELVGLGRSLQEVEGEMNRLDDVFRHPVDAGLARAEASTRTQAGELTVKLSGRVELRRVTYGYSRLDPPLLEDFSLHVPAGARVALVGPSASGKSTVARLLCGLFQPWSGDVLLDGRPRDEIPRVVVTHSLAFVDQDFFLPEGTVREVLTVWDHTASEEDVVRAAKDACIHEEVAARPGGYESRVEEGGANFSGGQRQRLEIARALVGNPSLVVLDEATSALDAVTEKRIDENLRRRGCTCVIVAHRLSTIRDCDAILVLDAGRVVQRGAHEELLAQDGPYRGLVQA